MFHLDYQKIIVDKKTCRKLIQMSCSRKYLQKHTVRLNRSDLKFKKVIYYRIRKIMQNS